MTSCILSPVFFFAYVNEMGWACGSYGEERGAYKVLVGKQEGKNRWGDLGVDEWIILGWICRRLVVGMWTGLG